MRTIDLIGKRFGRLFVAGRSGSVRGEAAWRCLCDCGTEHVVRGSFLRNKISRSCGCLQRDLASKSKVVHGARAKGVALSPEYTAWMRMLARCRNLSDPSYPRYGGRGIKVCQRWSVGRNAALVFMQDMGPRPSPAHSIDRIDNDGNYEPGNCRWATAKEQARNRRSNRIVVLFGDRMALAEAVERLGLDYRTVKARLRLGWSTDRALELA